MGYSFRQKRDRRYIRRQWAGAYGGKDTEPKGGKNNHYLKFLDIFFHFVLNIPTESLFIP